MQTNEIEKDIKEELHKSEIFVSWAQLFFSLFILLFWLVSIFNRKYSPTFEILPYFLGVYGFVSLIKLIFSYKRQINKTVLFLSIFFDVLIVTGLMWTFHIQYSQPPSLYLKSPTFIYYFFFIVLRNLRYEVSYVLTTGILSILSWLYLVSYALIHKETNITRSFIEYTKSHDILIGAEIEKLLGLIVVTVISAISVHRKKKLLITSKIDSFSKKNMSKFFSKEVVQNLSSSSSHLEVGTGVTRNAGILMIDLRNFTKITSTWSPKKTLCVISDYQEIVVPIILKNNGAIDKYMGDGIFAHFGAANESKTYAKDMLTAMQEIKIAAQNWNEDRSLKGFTLIDIGQASCVGSVIFGTTGSSTRLEYTTIGNAVNYAAKLEKYTKDINQKAITTKETYDLSLKQGLQNFDLNVQLSQKVPGINEEMDIVII